MEDRKEKKAPEVASLRIGPLIDDLDVSVTCLRNLLKVPSENRSAEWGHHCCTYSRFVHVRVWMECPSRESLIRNVIPLLKKIKKELLELCDRDDISEGDRQRIAAYAANFRMRIRNIENNYMKQKPSAFLPDEQLWDREPPSK